LNTAVERREIYFSGRVQGVGFRYTTRAIAARYSLGGFVQNLRDGRVWVVVEGTADAIERFVTAIVAEMGRYIAAQQQTVMPATGEFTNFEVRR
jgi:acylphosphatase